MICQARHKHQSLILFERGFEMTQIEQISEELKEYNVPDELIGKIENLLATLYGEKERLEILQSWDDYPERMGK